MAHLIDKDALVAEIERRKKAIVDDNGNLGFKDCQKAFNEIDELKKFINTLEVKEVDLNKELSYEDYMGFFNKHPDFPNDWGFDEAWIFAKHFFELGLNTQLSSIDIPNIDDIFEEEGIDPNSKDAKVFKECYYVALERLKEEKGEEV